MQSFSPVTSNKLYIQIYTQIRDAILAGQYALGDSLPSEKELCAMFQVSRVPVREALSALELNGFVDSIRGAGYRVIRATPTAEDLLRAAETRELFQLRAALEPDIARLAAVRLDDARRERLRSIIERFRREAQQGGRTAEADRELRRFLAEASGSTLYRALMEMVERATEQREPVFRRGAAAQKQRAQSGEAYLAVAEAVLDGNAGEAGARMKEHTERLLELIQDSTPVNKKKTTAAKNTAAKGRRKNANET